MKCSERRPQRDAGDAVGVGLDANPRRRMVSTMRGDDAWRVPTGRWHRRVLPIALHEYSRLRRLHIYSAGGRSKVGPRVHQSKAAESQGIGQRDSRRPLLPRGLAASASTARGPFFESYTRRRGRARAVRLLPSQLPYAVADAESAR